MLDQSMVNKRDTYRGLNFAYFIKGVYWNAFDVNKNNFICGSFVCFLEKKNPTPPVFYKIKI